MGVVELHDRPGAHGDAAGGLAHRVKEPLRAVGAGRRLGRAAARFEPIVNSVVSPDGVIRPIAFVVPWSMNHTLPSGPAVSEVGSDTPVVNSVIGAAVAPAAGTTKRANASSSARAKRRNDCSRCTVPLPTVVRGCGERNPRVADALAWSWRHAGRE